MLTTENCCEILRRGCIREWPSVSQGTWESGAMVNQYLDRLNGFGGGYMKSNKLARRSLISGLGLGVAALAGSSQTAIAQTQERQFRPARHSQDAWFDMVHGTHRNFIDASTTSGAAEAMLYANNLYEANK